MYKFKMGDKFHRFSPKSQNFGTNTVRNLILMAHLGFHEVNNTSEHIYGWLAKKKHGQNSRWRPKRPNFDRNIFNDENDFSALIY
mgnify:CR=1 FL=1